MEPVELTILMPCLDEAETIQACVEKAVAFLERSGIKGEVIVADNGSKDGSQELAQRYGARVVAVPRKGYGAALLGGIYAARGTFVIMGDADDSYDFADLSPFVEKLRSGFDLVMGNRFLGCIKTNAMPPLHRYLGNPVLTAIGRILFRSNVGDFHCGLRGFKREAIISLRLHSLGMEFASEMVVKSTLAKLKMTEVPTTLSPDGRSRRSHLRSWRDGWRHLRFLLLFSPVWLFFYPGLIMLILGTMAMAWLLPGQRSAAAINFDVNTLVFAAAAVVCGFQAIFFYIFAKTYAIRSGLLPQDSLVAKLREILRLEIGLVVGAAATACGLLLAAYAIGFWGVRSFGHLDPEKSLRIVIPSATLLMVGLQIIFSSCLLSVLELETNSSEASLTQRRRSGKSDRRTGGVSSDTAS